MTAPATETMIEADAWQAERLDELAETAARATLTYLGLAPEGFLVSVLGCDDARIAALNADFRGKPTPTNVLSWPSEDRDPDDLPGGDADDPEELGDIAIALETCRREAAEQGKSFRDHVTHLMVHAILHLFGYDHEEDDEAALMEATETSILATLGISDPYE